jgi:dihydropyrimidinase
MKRSTSYDLVIQNGIVVTADEAAQPPFKTHIGIRGEKIAAISEQALDGKTVIDASEKYVFPGMIDAHVHMALPVAGTVSSDDFYTGTVAAAFGGVTTIIDYTTPDVNQKIMESVQDRLKVARDAIVDYSFHAVIIGWHEGRSQEIA